MKEKKLIIIAGPTAAGKTSLSIKLCHRINGAVISADSMQVYKNMDIGSAKISLNEMNGIIHYGIDILDPKEEYNVTLFQKMAKESIKECYENDLLPVIVGGTGFYIQSVLYDISFEETNKNLEYRNKLNQIAKDKGQDYLHDLLKDVDPASASLIHPNNVKRVIRALEYYNETGQKISEHNEKEAAKKSPYNYKFFVITDNRELLYEKIDKRVDLMIKNGLVDEVLNLKNAGLDSNAVSMQGLGYKEILDYLDDKTSLEEAIDKIKKETRHFAKRQITWFKREKEAIWINKSDFKSEDEIIDFMIKKIEEQIK